MVLIMNKTTIVFAIFHTFLAATFYFLVILQSVE